jgi:hypothetical protein
MKALLTYPLRVDHPVSSNTENTQSGHEPDSAEREELESLYARLIRIPDRSVEKARALSMLGRAYQALYKEE